MDTAGSCGSDIYFGERMRLDSLTPQTTTYKGERPSAPNGLELSVNQIEIFAEDHNALGGESPR